VDGLVNVASESEGRVREVELNPVLLRGPGRGAIILDALWIEDQV
jgi:hypothetical protein